MNTIYYANLKTGERAAVKVGQGGVDWYEQNGQRNSEGKLPRNHSKRRRTMAEADEAMNAKGYVRWPRKKPLPQSLKKAA